VPEAHISQRQWLTGTYHGKEKRRKRVARSRGRGGNGRNQAKFDAKRKIKGRFGKLTSELKGKVLNNDGRNSGEREKRFKKRRGGGGS